MSAERLADDYSLSAGRSPVTGACFPTSITSTHTGLGIPAVFYMPGILSKILCYGQYFCIYPAAYDSEEERRRAVDPLLFQLGDIGVDIPTSNNAVLKCFLLKQTKLPVAAGTIIMFHGNGYHAWSYITCGMKFCEELGFNVLMVEYRGYGASTGSPSEHRLRRDSQAALDFVISRDDLPGPIVLHGHSMGGAVTIDLAYRNPQTINAIILENTFLSIPTMASLMPIVQHLTWFIHQRWNSAKKIQMIPRKIPILFLSGTSDEVVPAEHMIRLYDIASARDPTSAAIIQDIFKSFPRGTHADTWIQRDYLQSISTFLRSIVSVT
ncbi:alpha/beta-hydrolase [Cylindrobasidium torrendii FP15055 ss-10]|uniref:Alpha/beta-hydrolase n=1 Tax=Cylindrobasidium torrendii FP15055 ss-10 TaxID=1314674 RepID=A0A0D7B1R1_9AGAR|nr:alpha/beta-hydrolase [Cylindrobasidium torrendii FP15055 ss-10]